VIVVGAGPAGSTTAFYLAAAGLDVMLLEKTHFPREKVCGDGLTPRAVKALTAMGVPVAEGDGWLRNKGLRIIGGGGRIELPWPDLSSYPGFGLVRSRLDFDEILARHAQKAGVRLLEGVNVTGPLLDDRTGRIIGVTARETANGETQELQFAGRLVVAADGNSSRLSVAMGLAKRDDRPLGVAVRTYYTTPRHDDDYLEAWLDLWDGDKLLPGYGWIFGMGDGTSNVGLGLLNTSEAFGNIDYRPWGSTAPRTTPGACCWPGTPAGWSTRSTARASATRWRRARSPPGPSSRRWPGPPPRARRPCCTPTRGSSRTPGAATTRSAARSCTRSAIRRS
jgi:geranylgeranyl reductase family protein